MPDPANQHLHVSAGHSTPRGLFPNTVTPARFGPPRPCWLHCGTLLQDESGGGGRVLFSNLPTPTPRVLTQTSQPAPNPQVRGPSPGRKPTVHQHQPRASPASAVGNSGPEGRQAHPAWEVGPGHRARTVFVTLSPTSGAAHASALQRSHTHCPGPPSWQGFSNPSHVSPHSTLTPPLRGRHTGKLRLPEI